MLDDLSARLGKSIEQKRHKEKLEQDLCAVEAELQDKASQLAALKAQLDQEQVDVEKLERVSLAYLFYSVLGSREQQLEKERQELLSAQLRYQPVKHLVAHLKQERDNLRNALVQLAGTQAEYEAVLAEKEIVLLGGNPAAARQLLDITEELADKTRELNEISQAIAAGNGAVSDIDQAIRSLENAEAWGYGDLLGGGLLVDLAKHTQIDTARDSVTTAQMRISLFKRELADVQASANIHIDIGQLDTFLDFFFDGLIADWIVQSKIEESLTQANQAKFIIKGVVSRLEPMRKYKQSRLETLNEARARLLERAS